MSAINAIVQRDAVHILTDGLLYIDGSPAQVDLNKVYRIRNMRAVVTSTGPAGFGCLVATVLEQNCFTFDEVVSLESEYFRGLFDWYCKEYRGGDDACSLMLAGWLEKTDRPALFAIEMSVGGKKLAKMRANNPANADCAACDELTELSVAAVPSPTLDELKAAEWPFGIDRNDQNAEQDLLRLMEVQRSRKLEDGKCYIGGECVLTTITRDGVEQRVVHRWKEDRVGEVIRPILANYKAA